MKATIFLIMGFSLWQSASAQISYSDYLIIHSGTSTKEGVQIKDRIFSASTQDTTYGLDISKLNTVYVALQTKDSATALISYQLSLDNVTWTAATLKDSLTQNADGDTVKTVDFSTIAMGAKFIRWVFQFSPYSFSLGTTTPTYTATWKAKQ